MVILLDFETAKIEIVCQCNDITTNYYLSQPLEPSVKSRLTKPLSWMRNGTLTIAIKKRHTYPALYRYWISESANPISSKKKLTRSPFRRLAFDLIWSMLFQNKHHCRMQRSGGIWMHLCVLKIILSPLYFLIADDIKKKIPKLFICIGIKRVDQDSKEILEMTAPVWANTS